MIRMCSNLIFNVCIVFLAAILFKFGHCMLDNYQSKTTRVKPDVTTDGQRSLNRDTTTPTRCIFFSVHSLKVFLRLKSINYIS